MSEAPVVIRDANGLEARRTNCTRRSRSDKRCDLMTDAALTGATNPSGSRSRAVGLVDKPKR